MTITLRGNKSTALTFSEMDGNFTDLDGRLTTVEGAYVTSVNGITASSNAVTITTANITEATNLYYTDARARASISVTDAGGDGSLAYNNTTGVLTYTGPSAAEVRAHISAGAGITLSSGEISIGNDAIKDTMIDFGTGANQVSTADIPEQTNLYYTDGRADARIAVASIDDLQDVQLGSLVNGYGLVYNSGSGRIELAELPGAAGGEANTGSNVGTGVEVFQGKAGVDFKFRKINANTGNISVTQNTDDIDIDVVPNPIFGNIQINSEANTIENISTNANLILSPHGTGTVDVSSARITSVTDPTGAQDAATKAYVDTATSSISTVLAIAGGTGTDNVTVGTDTLTFAGTTNEIETAVTNNQVQVGLPINVTVSNDLTVGNALTVTGNLTVNGTTTTVSSSELAVTDGKIQIGVNNESSDTIDMGFVGHYYNGVRRGHAGLFRDATDKKFKLMGDYGPEPDQPTINTDDEHFELADLQLRSLEIGNTDAPSMAIRGSRLETINSNQDIELETSGTGIVNVGADVQLKAQSDLRFADADSSHYVAFQAPATIASNITWTLPSADAGVSGYALISNGSGTLSWAAAGATTTSDTTTNAEEQIYFGDITSGAVTAFHHDADLTYNPSTGSLSSDVFIGALTGNASTASALQTARAIALSGDVVGTANFDGSAGISIATTIQANSVALGTDTTGNYVAAGATSGSGISGSVSSEGGTFTVTSNATNANTASTIVFRDGSGNFSAGTITANLTGTASNITSQANSATITASTTNTANHIVLRDGSGNFAAGTITATATSAQYADLAEVYATDRVYPAGTVVMIGGEAEATAANNQTDYLAGVVSTDPAYLMNKDADGQAIALVGRVPVRVLGSVTKGQPVFAANGGLASTTANGPLVGIALETNSNSSEKSVECLLKV